MDKKYICKMRLKTEISVFLSALFLVAACSPPEQKPLPVYVWQSIGTHMNMDTLQMDFHKWKSHGVTGVCIETRSLEQVKEASARAHAEGLEYHAWIPSMMRKGLPHGWYAVNRLGQSADQHPSYLPNYRFLDPANPDVQEFLKDQYLEIARIPDVDYVRLDFIRYPDVILASALGDVYGVEDTDEEYPPADYCYCDRCVSTFMEQTGIDIRNVEEPEKVTAWAQFRCDQLTLFVDRMARAIHEVGKKVSVDVFPGPISYAEHMVRQQWNQWVVDMFFPMNYNDFYGEDLDWLKDVVAEEVEAAGHTPVMSGLRIGRAWEHKENLQHPFDLGLAPAEMETAILNSLNSGAAGVCFLSPSRMCEDHWTALDNALKNLANQK